MYALCHRSESERSHEGHYTPPVQMQGTNNQDQNQINFPQPPQTNEIDGISDTSVWAGVAPHPKLFDSEGYSAVTLLNDQQGWLAQEGIREEVLDQNMLDHHRETYTDAQYKPGMMQKPQLVPLHPPQPNAHHLPQVEILQPLQENSLQQLHSNIRHMPQPSVIYKKGRSTDFTNRIGLLHQKPIVESATVHNASLEVYDTVEKPQKSVESSGVVTSELKTTGDESVSTYEHTTPETEESTVSSVTDHRTDDLKGSSTTGSIDGEQTENDLINGIPTTENSTNSLKQMKRIFPLKSGQYDSDDNAELPVENLEEKSEGSTHDENKGNSVPVKGRSDNTNEMSVSSNSVNSAQLGSGNSVTEGAGKLISSTHPKITGRHKGGGETGDVDEEESSLESHLQEGSGSTVLNLEQENHINKENNIVHNTENAKIKPVRNEAAFRHPKFLEEQPQQ